MCLAPAFQGGDLGDQGGQDRHLGKQLRARIPAPASGRRRSACSSLEANSTVCLRTVNVGGVCDAHPRRGTRYEVDLWKDHLRTESCVHMLRHADAGFQIVRVRPDGRAGFRYRPRYRQSGPDRNRPLGAGRRGRPQRPGRSKETSMPDGRAWGPARPGWLRLRRPPARHAPTDRGSSPTRPGRPAPCCRCRPAARRPRR
jgi:hypothetical protein